MPVRMTAGLIDRTVLVTQDGSSLELHGASRRYTLTEENYGFPPVEYVTQRGPFQHGESVMDYFLRPRPVQLVVRWSACSRKEYWDNRSTLLDYVRPRVAQGLDPKLYLRKYLANGAVRQLDVVPDGAPAFGPRDLDKWDEFAFSEALRFMAYNPVWYDPTQKSASGVLSLYTVLVACAYAGTWPDYPTIRITGPVTAPIVTNLDTGEELSFPSLTIAAGDYVEIVLAYGKKTALTNAGANVLGYLSAASDLGNFHLAPAPEAASGTNDLELSGSGTTGATTLLVTWYNRFIGI